MGRAEDALVMPLILGNILLSEILFDMIYGTWGVNLLFPLSKKGYLIPSLGGFLHFGTNTPAISPAGIAIALILASTAATIYYLRNKLA